MYDLRRGHVKYIFNTNTITNDDLKYQLNGDKKYKGTVVNFKSNGTQQKEVFGEDGGDSLTIYTYNASSKSQMELQAKAEVARLKTNGYKGSIETFLLPYCEPGMIALINDPQFTERAGNYYIGTVVTTFDTGGGRRQPALEIKVE